MNSKLVRVKPESLEQVKKYYESTYPKLEGMFSDSLIIEIALKSILKIGVTLEVEKNKIKIKQKK